MRPEYVAAVGGALGAAMQSDGEEEGNAPGPSARTAFIAAILVRLDRYWVHARRRRRDVLSARLRAVSKDEREISNILSDEEALEVEYAQKQKERIRQKLAIIAALPDPAERVAQVQALMREERRIDRLRSEAMLLRAEAAANKADVQEVSPDGAYWVLGARENHCPVCLFMANRFWPWEVLDEVNPPVHHFCGCELKSLSWALQAGLLKPGEVPSKTEAIALARGLVLDEEAAEDAWLRVTGIGELFEAAGFAGFDPNLHPRNNLGQFIETLFGLAPKGTGGAWSVKLDARTTVSREADGLFKLTSNNRMFKGFSTPQDVAVAALNRSAKMGFEGTVGGTTKHKDFDAYMKQEWGVDADADSWVALRPSTNEPGLATKQEIVAEMGRVGAEMALAQNSPDKYVQRTAAELKKRHESLKRKAKKAPETHPGQGLPEPELSLSPGNLPVIRREKLPNGKYRITRDGVEITKASSVPYTHAAIFVGSDPDNPIVTFHKTAEAAAKTKGESGPDGPYWKKLGHVAMEIVGEDDGPSAFAAGDYVHWQVAGTTVWGKVVTPATGTGSYPDHADVEIMGPATGAPWSPGSIATPSESVLKLGMPPEFDEPDEGGPGKPTAAQLDTISHAIDEIPSPSARVFRNEETGKGVVVGKDAAGEIFFIGEDGQKQPVAGKSGVVMKLVDGGYLAPQELPGTLQMPGEPDPNTVEKVKLAIDDLKPNEQMTVTGPNGTAQIHRGPHGDTFFYKVGDDPGTSFEQEGNPTAVAHALVAQGFTKIGNHPMGDKLPGGDGDVIPHTGGLKAGDIVEWTTPEGKVRGEVQAGPSSFGEGHVAVKVTWAQDEKEWKPGQIYHPHATNPNVGVTKVEDAKPGPAANAVKKADVKTNLEGLPQASGYNQLGYTLYRANGNKVVFKRFYDGSYRAIEHKHMGTKANGEPYYGSGSVVKKKTMNVDGLAKWAEKEGLVSTPTSPPGVPDPTPAVDPAQTFLAMPAEAKKTVLAKSVGELPVGGVFRYETAADGSDFIVWRKTADEYSVKAVGSGPGSSKVLTAAAMPQFLVDAKATNKKYEVDKKTGLPVGAPPPAVPKAPEPDDGWDVFKTDMAAEAALDKLSADAKSSMSSAEGAALSAYTGSNSGAINGQLREMRGIGSAAIEEKIIALDSLLDKHGAVPEDLLLWRGVNGKTAQNYKAAEVGSILRDNGYGSTSTRESFADGWGNVLMKIRWPQGARAIWAKPQSVHKSESEVLLPRGVAFRVLHKRVRAGGKTELVVEPVSGHK